MCIQFSGIVYLTWLSLIDSLAQVQLRGGVLAEDVTEWVLWTWTGVWTVHGMWDGGWGTADYYEVLLFHALKPSFFLCCLYLDEILMLPCLMEKNNQVCCVLCLKSYMSKGLLRPSQWRMICICVYLTFHCLIYIWHCTCTLTLAG